MFVVIRDLCIARTGTWSASTVLAIAELTGYRARRATALATIRGAIGVGISGVGRPPKLAENAVDTLSIIGGEKPPDFVPGGTADFVPGTKSTLFPTSFPRKKKEAKKKETLISTPTDTSYLSTPDFGDLEADVELYVATAAEENKSGRITPGRRLSLRRELQAVLDAVGDRDAFAYGVRTANSAGAPNPRYVEKCARNAPLLRSRESQNGGSAKGSHFVPGASKYQEPSNDQLELAASLEKRFGERKS